MKTQGLFVVYSFQKNLTLSEGDGPTSQQGDSQFSKTVSGEEEGCNAGVTGIGGD